MSAFGGAFGLATALEAQGSAAASPKPRGVTDPFDLVDPELRPAARRMQNSSLRLLTSIAALRTGSAAFVRPQLPEVPVLERHVQGLNGAPDVNLYVINAQSGFRPGVLYIHGGGFVSGSASGMIRDLQDLATAVDCVIVGVDYRLAPETRYSGSVDDNFAGLAWMHANAAALGVDPGRIAVMGESAGGGHAALLTLAARDLEVVHPCFQMLIYPALDDRTGVTHRTPRHIGTIGWTPESNRFAWRAFLGREPGGKTIPSAAVPARVSDLTGLPPTFIGVGSLDLFVGESMDYARRLIEAGVPTELLVVPGAFHAFDYAASDTSVAARFREAKRGALRRAFANGSAQALS